MLANLEGLPCNSQFQMNCSEESHCFLCELLSSFLFMSFNLDYHSVIFISPFHVAVQSRGCFGSGCLGVDEAILLTLCY